MCDPVGASCREREGGEEEEEEPPGYCEEAAAALYVFIHSAVESTPKYLIVNVLKVQILVNYLYLHVKI